MTPNPFLKPEAALAAFVQVTGAPVDELKGPARTADITRLRHEAMWLLRDLTSVSLAKVGVMLGGRNLKTVIEGVDRVQMRAVSDTSYRARIRQLRDDVAARAQGVTGLPTSAQIIAAKAVLEDPNLSHPDARKTASQLLRGAIL